MEKIKVFQLQRKAFDSNGYLIPKEQRTNKILCIGTVLVPKNKTQFVEDAIWDLFNWTCWNWGKLQMKSWIYGIRNGIRRDGYRSFPNHNSYGYCNSDIFFKLKDKWMIAKSVGWDKAGSYEEAVEKIIKQQKL